jgi:hypothetical protein
MFAARRPSSRVVLATAVAALGLVTVANAASQATASATARTRIIKPLTISAPAQMSFGRLQYNAGSGPAVSPVVLSSQPPAARTSPNVQLLPGGTETPAIRTITGQPGAVYRVTTPTSATATPEGLTVNTFTVWSANSGNITATRLGQLNASGVDTIRVGASLQAPVKTKNDTYTANVPITITYD